MTPPALNRRTLLAAGVVAATGCGDDPPSRAPGQPVAKRDPTPAHERKAWVPSGGEVEPAAKLLAAEFAVHLATRRDLAAARADLAEALTQAAAQAGSPPGIDVQGSIAAARELFAGSGSSTADVVYPQLSGRAPLTGAAEQIGVMVVLQQNRTVANGSTTSLTRTIDVWLRLDRPTGRLAVWRLDSGGGVPVPRPAALSADAVAVLDDPRIRLPDTARWDIHAGRVDSRLLALMPRLAAVYPYEITVLQTGHPHDVFGTRRISNHTVGRAVDVHAIAGRSVASQRTMLNSTAHRFARAAAQSPGVAEVGSPWDDDGPGRVMFANIVHLDHVHVGFGYRPATPRR